MGVVLGSRPMASKSARIASNVAATVIGQPFDGSRQVINPAEAMLDGRHHQVSHVVTGDAACGGEEAHGFPVTAVECEGDPHSLAIVAADLEAIGTPAPITFIDRDATVMPALGTTGMATSKRSWTFITR